MQSVVRECVAVLSMPDCELCEAVALDYGS